MPCAIGSMRTATDQTRRALKAAIGDAPYSRWARENGLRPVDVHRVLAAKSMSIGAENVVRAVLGLDLICYRVVELADNQRVVTTTKTRQKVRPAPSIWPEKRDRWREFARANGYRSVPHLMEHATDSLVNGNSD